MTTSATRTVITAKIPGLTGGDYTLLVKSSNLELNESRAPYGRIELTVALPGSTVLAQITPYSSLRITGTITHSWVTPVRAAQTRSFDFLLHERTINHTAGTLTLVGHTDEALLLDRYNVSTTLARTYGLAVRAAVEYALGVVGARLWKRRNLLNNPSGRRPTTGYAAVNGSIGQDAGADTYLFIGTSQSTAAAYLTLESMVIGAGKLEPLTTYTYSLYAFGTIAVGISTSGAASVLASMAAGGFTRLSVTFTTAASGTINFHLYNAAAAAAGSVIAFRDAQIEVGSVATAYLDGALTDTATDEYNWTGAADNSPSTVGPPVADAVLTSKTLEPVVTNLITNPSFETNTTGWANETNSALTRATSGGLYGVCALRHQINITGFSTAGSYTTITTVAGKQYTASAWVKAASGTRSVSLGLSGIGAGTAVATDATWRRISYTFTATGTSHNPIINPTNAGASGDAILIDGVMVTEGAAVLDTFDGSTIDPGLYAYAWTSTANGSTSTKTNLPNSDATIWRPGQSLYDFLSPILQASNRRLFCDENRQWRLVDSGYTLDGTLTVSEGFNAKTATDTMSRQKTEQGIPTWFDHVIVHYSWKDSLGVSQEMWDSASAGTVKGYLVEVTTPWPGPGAAAGILLRATGRGRTQDITALTDYAATPGMAVVTTLPGTPIQSGTLSSIAWRWDESGDDMTVSSRGLINTPANAWIFATGAWSAASGTWAAATGTG